MLIVSIAMILSTFAVRVRVSPTSYETPFYAIVLVFAGFAIFGMSMVLLLQSPFRTPPGERIFRVVWLGPIGRGFVWLAARGVESGSERTPTIRTLGASVTAPRVSSVVTVASRPTQDATPARPTPGALPEPTVIREPLAAIEARVDALEEWRRARGE